MRRLLLVLLIGCAAPPRPPPRAPAPAAVPAPLLIEYVVITRRWVERQIATSPDDVKAWSEAPENAEAVGAGLRHVVVKDRAKAQALLDRVKKGEELATLARQHSEDQESKETGGVYPVEKVEASVREAWRALDLGAVTLVQSSTGFHVVRKERASEERIERAYRKAKAPEAQVKLAAELLARLKAGGPSRAAIADATLNALGERAANAADRPHATTIDIEHVKQARLPDAAKAALETFARSAHDGDTLPSPAVDGDTIVVARAATTLR